VQQARIHGRYDPNAFELASAAAFSTAAGTAWQALVETADLKPGQTALIMEEQAA